jgi:LytS/YehU family sensor histidine kinase
MIIKGQLLHLESKSRLNQLKPHFIFNALIPLQHHILMKNEDKALTYLDDFSQLMRKMLEMSAQDTISLKNEIDFLNKYLLIQQAEQSYSFQFSITTQLSELEMFSIKIPNLLLHPLIENAIMHGLNNSKKKEGYINIHISKKGNYLTISIANNSKKILEQYIVKLMKGHALHIIQERIALMNTKKDPNVGLFFETNETNFVAKVILLIDEN